MISEPGAFSFDVFSDFQFWRSTNSFFEYHLEYFEVPPSHESGHILIGASAFYVLTLEFHSIFVIYLVVFLLFYLLMRYCTKPLQTNVISNSAERCHLLIKFVHVAI